MNEKRHLKIVPFSGSDLSTGECLLEKSGTTTSDTSSISNKLSLLLHYEEYAWAGTKLPGPGKKLTPCKITYDQDEATPTELILSFESKTNPESIILPKKIDVSFEIFRVCYEFSSNVLSYDISHEENIVRIFLEIPEKITTLKHRRHQRIKIEKGDIKVPKVTLHNSTLDLEISELGLNSIVTKLPEDKKEDTNCELTFHTNKPFKLMADRINRSGTTAFRLTFKDAKEFGEYFDIYRKLAYPELRKTSEFPPQDRLSLYKKTGYFDGFNADKSENTDNDILNTWTSIQADEYSTNVDFLAADENELLIGASSVSLAFQDIKSEYWAFHQLCSVKSPDLLTASGHLYMWRADYLAGLPQDLKIILWFRSESRWLERIYVKFSRQSTNKIFLAPIKLIKGKHFKTDTKTTEDTTTLKSLKFGTYNRVISIDDNFISGFGPTYLNASQLLNHICIFNESEDISKAKKAMDSLLSKSESESANFYVSLAEKSTQSINDWKACPSDRLCIFSKNDLIDFLSSVEHSIAVTRKKSLGS